MVPTGDIDYIIMTNAHEESLLWHLLIDYNQEYPDIETSDALNNLKKRLSELVSEGKVGMYGMEAGRTYDTPDEYQELQTSDALALIQEDGNWNAPTADAKSMMCLYARDKQYFGTYFGSSKDES